MLTTKKARKRLFNSAVLMLFLAFLIVLHLAAGEGLGMAIFRSVLMLGVFGAIMGALHFLVGALAWIDEGAE